MSSYKEFAWPRNTRRHSAIARDQGRLLQRVTALEKVARDHHRALQRLLDESRYKGAQAEDGETKPSKAARAGITKRS